MYGNRYGKGYAVLALVVGISMFSAGLAHPEDASAVRGALTQRFAISTMDVQDPGDVGFVVKRGTILAVQADGIPAKPVRVTQAPKSPRFHVADFARVEVTADGQLRAEAAEMTLPRGTRLAVLKLKVEGDRVRLFTHTLAPVDRPGGKAIRGCTEFVFRFEPADIESARLFTIEDRIARWLPVAAAR
jgi:hypothetical protein